MTDVKLDAKLLTCNSRKKPSRYSKKTKFANLKRMLWGDLLKIDEHVNELFEKAINYRTVCLIKQPSHHNDDMASELHCLAKNRALQRTVHSPVGSQCQ